jgi:hypothetical protein
LKKNWKIKYIEDFLKNILIIPILGEFLRDKMYNSIPGLAKQTDDQKAASLALFEQIAGGALQSS